MPDGAEQSGFDKLKQLITSTPILVLPDQTKHFQLETAYVTGAILSQLYDDGKWRPVEFVSKSLLETEHNYAIHDKELLSVIRRLEEWQHIVTLHVTPHRNSDPHFPMTRVRFKTPTAYLFYPQTLIMFSELRMPDPP